MSQAAALLDGTEFKLAKATQNPVFKKYLKQKLLCLLTQTSTEI